MNSMDFLGGIGVYGVYRCGLGYPVLLLGNERERRDDGAARTNTGALRDARSRQRERGADARCVMHIVHVSYGFESDGCADETTWNTFLLCALLHSTYILSLLQHRIQERKGKPRGEVSCRMLQKRSKDEQSDADA